MAADYAGAVGRITRERAARLLADRSRRWVAQPKADGAYLRVITGRDGAVLHCITRAGEMPPSLMSLRGNLTGCPDAILHGEVEWHTEAGNAAHKRQGYRRVHLFDITRIDGRDLSRETYSVRRDHLMRGLTACQVDCHGNSTDSASVRNRRDPVTGQFAVGRPINWGLFPVVPQSRNLDQAWIDWVVMPYGHPPASGLAGEGLVIVDTTAPVGARNAKYKLKTLETIDCVVVRVSAKTSLLSVWQRVFVASNLNHRLSAGMIVEVAHNGWYQGGQPRFPRITRIRRDLMA